MRERCDLVRIGIATRGGVERFCEGDFESVRLNGDALDFERGFAAPFETFESERLDAANGPTAIGAAAKQVARRSECRVEYAGREPFAERIARALPHAV